MKPSELEDGRQSDLMEWEDTSPACAQSEGKDGVGGLFFILDTNILLDPAFKFEELLEMTFVGQDGSCMVPPCIVLPWKVLEELDCLKKEQKDQEIKPEREVDLCLRARRAIGEINKFLKNEHPRVIGQRKERGSLDKYFKASTSDDVILQSCLCLREENPSALIILLSNDLNLANKALDQQQVSCNSSTSSGYESLQNQQIASSSPGKTHLNVQLADKLLLELKELLTKDLSYIMVHELQAAFKDSDWRKMVKKPPPWKTRDMLDILLKMWISVFGLVWPRCIKSNIENLRKTFLEISTVSRVCTHHTATHGDNAAKWVAA
ncbi:unnamed protein product [Darwinula stevensoni]|uniref:PIN domain-containing protein n=1 Tax=Darwinula stevensoni TaxID=69355 RepID=A0A7R9ABW3_9CRUS|nr:unnamed protein product [Darwinula stevensoni]CAG0899441.1 unnamed protein product [Darwinula stevensoni]